MTRGSDNKRNNHRESRTKGGQYGEKALEKANRSGIRGEAAEEYRKEAAQVVCQLSPSQNETQETQPGTAQEAPGAAQEFRAEGKAPKERRRHFCSHGESSRRKNGNNETQT